MSTSEDELPSFISTLLEKQKNVVGTSKAITIQPTDWLFAATLDILSGTEVKSLDLLITCGEASQLPPMPASRPKHIHLECRKGKLGSRDLRQQLSKITGLLNDAGTFTNIYVSCPTGKDLSIGVILVILCLYTTENGKNSRAKLIGCLLIVSQEH